MQVPYTDYSGRIAEDSFVMFDEVHVGLYHEFADGVFAGVHESEAMATLGSGTLIFSQAAYGFIGSSFEIFRRLSRCVLSLLACDKPSPTDDELAALVGGELERIQC